MARVAQKIENLKRLENIGSLAMRQYLIPKFTNLPKKHNDPTTTAGIENDTQQ
ncbi:MAG: hypothetical protein IKL20_02030 [Alistipes sp.]|nr:hypothetical protein [Alistipes sp.]